MSFFYCPAGAWPDNIAVMKVFLSISVLSVLLAATAVADIHMPPAAEQGPTRKLGRGLGNIVFGFTEIPHQIARTNDREGNAAAASYGAVRGVGRTFARLGYGIYEVLLFPFPVNKGKYTAPYRLEDQWLTAGYTEFPPELGWETRFDWCR